MSCFSILDSTGNADVAIACFQAQAAFDAARIQADAALASGNMTMMTGVAAVGATLMAAGFAYMAARRQIDITREVNRETLLTTQRLQAEALQASDTQAEDDRQYAVRRDVYLNVATGLFTGLTVMSRFNNSRIPLLDAAQPYYDLAPQIAQIHMVAPLPVLRKVLHASVHIASAHFDLIDWRNHVNADMANNIPPNDDFHLMVNSLTAKLIPPLSEAVVEMRADLGLPIDPELYERTVREMLEIVAERGEASIELARTLWDD